MSKCDMFLAIFVDNTLPRSYNTTMMTLQNFFNANESYTYKNWEYRDVYVGFSRLYYIVDGEGYYEEDGQTARFKKGYLYLTSVKKKFSLYDNPQNQLLHTYSHVFTTPPVSHFTEIEVVEVSLLAYAVDLYRKHIHADEQTLSRVIQFLLSCVEQTLSGQSAVTRTAAEKAKAYLDGLQDFSLDMATLSHAVGYSREHITRSFFDTYHTTPKQYFEQARMNAALRRLLDGERISAVAEAMRFSSPYAFSKAFKRYYGLSPKKYLATLEPKET